jgi:translation initiation factor IF-1
LHHETDVHTIIEETTAMDGIIEQETAVVEINVGTIEVVLEVIATETTIAETGEVEINVETIEVVLEALAAEIVEVETEDGPIIVAARINEVDIQIVEGKTIAVEIAEVAIMKIQI